MSRHLLTRRHVLIGASATAGLAALPLPAVSAGNENDGKTFSKNEIMQKAEGFFGATTKGLAEVIEKAFADHGRPNALILGSEAGGAFVVGVRFGEGHLERKQGAGRKIYWQGPSAGFDFGGNASKVFTLIYHLANNDDMFQRFPGVDGSLYIVAGASLNYQQSGKMILAPIRTGVGLRAGANVGYVHYTREHSWVPL